VITNSFEKTVELWHRAIDASLIRRDVIAHNMSNSQVPNYKRQIVNFEAELKRALDTEKNRPALELNLADPRHIPNWRERDYRDVEPRRVLDYTSTYNNNGNNVDPEQELTAALENQMSYTLLAQAAAFEFGQISRALR
jgi:flagellar basal-body rod protein FlgB